MIRIENCPDIHFLSIKTIHNRIHSFMIIQGNLSSVNTHHHSGDLRFSQTYDQDQTFCAGCLYCKQSSPV